MRDHILENGPDVVYITETKVNYAIEIDFKEQEYNVWRRDRRGKSGVFIMVHEKLYVEKIQYGDELAEVLSITIRSGSEKSKIIVACSTKD